MGFSNEPSPLSLRDISPRCGEVTHRGFATPYDKILAERYEEVSTEGSIFLSQTFTPKLPHKADKPP